MTCEFDKNFYLIVKMSLNASQSETADGTIIQRALICQILVPFELLYGAPFGKKLFVL